MTTEESFDFAGKLKVPLRGKHDGNPSMWEEWSWNFKTYTGMFINTVKILIDDVEGRDRPLLDADLTITLDTGDVDPQAALQAVNFPRKLHHSLANLTTGSARLIVRQNEGANGFETWRRMNEKNALPDATRHVSLLTQLLDFKFNPATFEQDFHTWETVKSKYETLSGTNLPDSVLVATLLNKTGGALQQHLCLNARTLTTYPQMRAVIVEYFRSRHILHTSSSSQGPAPMDIGYVGKGKGKKVKLSNSSRAKLAMLKGLRKGKGKNPHWKGER